jgi:hypothetical protein
VHVTEGPDVENRTPAPEVIVRCAWCERIKVEDAWIDADVEAHAFRSTPDAVALRSHGICPDCFAELTP